MIAAYKMPVVVEKFIDGPEITVVVFDDGAKKALFPRRLGMARSL